MYRSSASSEQRTDRSPGTTAEVSRIQLVARCASGLLLVWLLDGRAAAARDSASAATERMPPPAISARDHARIHAKVQSEAERLRRDAQSKLTAGLFERACFLLAAAQTLEAEPGACVQLGESCLHGQHPIEARMLLECADDPRLPSELTGRRDALRAALGAVAPDEAIQRVHLLREHMRAAQRAFDNESPRLAADLLSLLYLLAPEARAHILYNLAQSYRRLKRYEIAFALYDRVRTSAAQGPVSLDEASSLAERAMQELQVTALKPAPYRRPWFIATAVLSAAALVAISATAAKLTPDRVPTDAGSAEIQFP